jgi:hypothetical protein
MQSISTLTTYLGQIGETVDALLCEPDGHGYPDRRNAIPVRLQVLSEHALSVGPPRGAKGRAEDRHGRFARSAPQSCWPSRRLPASPGARWRPRAPDHPRRF